MNRLRIVLLVGGLLALAGLPFVGPARADTTVGDCSVPVIGDPDFVAVGTPVSANGVTTVAVTASESPGELGPGAPLVRLRLYIHGDVKHVLAESLAPFNLGPVSLSGPVHGAGRATETISIRAPGTYTFDYIALFDNAIHPCTSLDGTAAHRPVVLTVPNTA